jgi:hypothetical protein
MVQTILVGSWDKEGPGETLEPEERTLLTDTT